MKTKVFALLAVLVMFAGVFTSCDKNDLDPVIPQQNEQLAQSAPASKELRSSRATYTVAQRYKNSYVHDTPFRHDIATGFVSWFNCIARAHGTPLLTVDEVFRKCGVTAPDYYLHINTIKNNYPSLTVSAFHGNGQGTSPKQELENYFSSSAFHNGRPCAILIENNYSGQWKNVLVTVLTYQDGVVYYQDAKALTLGSLDIDTFVSRAMLASDYGDRINYILI